MNDNKKETEQPLKPGDMKGLRNKHAELHALLTYICQDKFKTFAKLSGKEQQDLLRLALSASDSLGDCLNPYQNSTD